MIYPGETRLRRANVSRFFSDYVRPQLPDDVAMPNDGEDTPLRTPLSNDLVDLVSANTQHCILLSF